MSRSLSSARIILRLSIHILSFVIRYNAWNICRNWLFRLLQESQLTLFFYNAGCSHMHRDMCWLSYMQVAAVRSKTSGAPCKIQIPYVYTWSWARETSFKCYVNLLSRLRSEVVKYETSSKKERPCASYMLNTGCLSFVPVVPLLQELFSPYIPERWHANVVLSKVLCIVFG